MPAEGVVTLLIAMAVFGGIIVVMSEVAVMLQQMHQYLRYAYPFAQIHGGEAI